MPVAASDLAERIVALAVAPTTGGAKSTRESLNDAVAAAVRRSNREWTRAAQQAVAHVLLVARNNPGVPTQEQDVAKILARPDVRQAFRQPFEKAAEQTRKAVKDALEEGWTRGGEQAAAALEGLGLHGYDLPLEQNELLKSVLDDVDRNMKSSLDRLSEAFADTSGRQNRLEAVGRDLQKRAQYSVEYALRRAAEERRAQEYAMAGVGLMWVSRLADNTCSYCLALHGKVVGPGESFTVDPKLPVYKDLRSPPRHPNCQCVVVPVLLKEGQKRSKSVTEEAAQAESAAIQKAIEQKREPKSISSDALRRMPSSVLPKLVAWFVKWLVGK